MPLHVSSTCAHHQEVKIALHSLWYHHTYRSDDTRNRVQLGWSGVRAAGSSQLPGHHSSLTAPNLQHTANQESYDQFGNQHRGREFLMMGIVMPETCWASKKHNKNFYEKRNAHFIFSNPPPENGAVDEIMWEICYRTGQATNANMARARCMLNT